MSDPLRHLRSHQHLHGTIGANDRFGPAAETFARFFGTVTYLAWQTLIVIIWIIVNAAGLIFRWDPYPFILLNLLFSTQAAYAAPLILLAQNRQAARDKASEEAAAVHREELNRQMIRLIEDNTGLTEEVHRLTDEIHRRIK